MGKMKTSLISVGIVFAFVIVILIASSFGMNAYGQNNEGSTKVNNSKISNNKSQGTNVAVDVDLNKLKIAHAGGGLSSLQTDADNKMWVTGGRWDLQSNTFNTTSKSGGVDFNATIDMRGIDNSAPHSHKVSDFKLSKMSVDSTDQGSAITFNGTATIESPVGLNTDIPISIKLLDDGQVFLSSNAQSGIVEPKWSPKGGIIILTIDPKINDHFGKTPVYGSIKKE
jgi:hypothetical protein